MRVVDCRSFKSWWLLKKGQLPILFMHQTATVVNLMTTTGKLWRVQVRKSLSGNSSVRGNERPWWAWWWWKDILPFKFCKWDIVFFCTYDGCTCIWWWMHMHTMVSQRTTSQHVRMNNVNELRIYGPFLPPFLSSYSSLVKGNTRVTLVSFSLGRD